MSIRLRVKLDELLKKHDLTQKELKERIEQSTGKTVRAAAISELYNNQRTSLNKELMELIATELQINDLNELVELVDDEDSN
ncbi:helix-turn-helix transcriptional regulator [Neobacillus niacini]|uniref:helix-turn-helix domain-containing protein n=1 Tax=Neobacillus niacini TaxID=86668 RepID=UPI0021CB668D|nr:helix-turn-helix transcriptional regulator [Neobacillus niacini]MCM3764605.1 helix-turn-helix transcriptional regulator [Neobacillus niacini]